MSMDAEVEIVEYDNSLAPAFKELNIAWLKKYFEVEAIDEEMLSAPEEFILDKGGYIFFAMIAGKVAGTFALIKMQDGLYELGKMAVEESFQGQGIGNKMLAFLIDKAKELGIKKLMLYSNTKLQPAIHLYKKFGFEEVPLTPSEYKRSNIRMERRIE